EPDTAQLDLIVLCRSGSQQARKPGRGHADGAAVSQIDPHRVLVKADGCRGGGHLFSGVVKPTRMAEKDEPALHHGGISALRTSSFSISQEGFWRVHLRLQSFISFSNLLCTFVTPVLLPFYAL